ncbi:MAG: translation initiation factor IF-2 [Brevinematia bacterium]
MIEKKKIKIKIKKKLVQKEEERSVEAGEELGEEQQKQVFQAQKRQKEWIDSEVKPLVDELSGSYAVNGERVREYKKVGWEGGRRDKVYTRHRDSESKGDRGRRFGERAERKVVEREKTQIVGQRVFDKQVYREKPKHPSFQRFQKPSTTPVLPATGKKGFKGSRKDSYRFETLEEESFESKLDVELLKKQKEKTYAVPEEIEIYNVITVGDLAKKMNVKASDLIEILGKLGLSVTINDKIDSDTATVVAEEFGTKVKVKSVFDEINVSEEPDDERYVDFRIPVVTVMGHVDHGKTTLLDAIRNTNVAQTEAGGITQHIGAYVVEVNGNKITFIDTPGHEAFTAMRAKGAKVTDIVILVVAADDGVKEQTIEALNHAKDAKVPIIVAINKIDVPGANPERVKNQLSELGLIPDDWGGDTIYVEISALKKLNIDKLLEAVLLQAELMELKADYHKKGVGFVIESKVEQGRGIVFTVVVRNGVVKVGDNFVVGTTSGKVRAIFDDKGRKVEKILPGFPGEIVGVDELPNAGDKFNVVESEEVAREIAEKRRYYSRIENIKSLRAEVNPFEEIKEMKYIVKGDVFGSVEAIKYSLEKLSNNEFSVRVVHWGVGQVNESDVMLASAGQASIIAFRTKVGPKAGELAEREKVRIKKYNIIYEIIEDVKREMKGLKEPVFEEKVLGVAEVRKVFKISGVGNVAGCYVRNGVIQRKSKVRIYRDNALIFDGEILSLKHLKDDVSEIREGFECGIAFKNFNDIKEGDVIEAYALVQQE